MGDTDAWTVKQTARQLGLSMDTVYGLVRSGVLPAVRLTGPRGSWLIPAESARRYLAERAETESAARRAGKVA